ncbi:MAG: S-layer homology domain-containing protein [Clostridia bacterium]|nr:S-layer homology domain-containing protein [Clostridia bacterium]
MKRKRLISMILALMLALCLLPAAMAAGLPFTDVPDGAWYASDVENAYLLGLINGKAPDKFAPDDNMTYAEAVKLAACMHQNAADGSITLKNGNPWYKTYVDYAKDNYIISKDYDWNAPATRAGYLEIFANALPFSMLSERNYVPEGGIPDVPISHPQAYEIYMMYRAGIVQGVDANFNCSPDSNIKRSEVAAILSRMTDPNMRKDFTVPAPKAPASPDFDYAAAMAVNEYLATATLPGGLKPGYTFEGVYDIYAVYDVDRDGQKELLFSIYNAPVAGQITAVYKLDTATGGLAEEYIGTNATIFLGNGTAICYLSHSTGLETDEYWPYDIYVYNKATDEYDYAASVSYWVKSVRDKDALGNKFPSDIDKDGDGIVALVTDADADGLEYLDGNDFEVWFSRYASESDWETVNDIGWHPLYQAKG